MLIWLVFIFTWLPVLFKETRYSLEGETSYIEIVLPRVMSLGFFIFFSSWFAQNSIMLFPSQHKLMHLYLNLEISDSLVPIHKSAFQFLTERNSLNCPRPKDFPILFPKDLCQIIWFTILSMLLPIFGMVPRIIEHKKFYLNKWSFWMSITVTFNDILLAVLMVCI